MNITHLHSTYESLVKELNNDTRVNEIEKCVILYQIGTFVGNDIFDEIMLFSNFECKRKDAIQFLEANASFIQY